MTSLTRSPQPFPQSDMMDNLNSINVDVSVNSVKQTPRTRRFTFAMSTDVERFRLEARGGKS